MIRLASAFVVLVLVSSGCAGTFGGVGRSTRISDGSRAAATGIVPDDAANRAIVEHLALAEEVYGKTLDALRERRDVLRSRRRALALGSYATFAATTIVISAAAISKANNGDSMNDSNLTTVGFGALGGLGVGTTLEVVNLMQEDPSSVEAKIRHLQTSYDNMVERLRTLFEERSARAAEAGAPGAKSDGGLEAKAGPIIETFINEALQINVKG
jgi:hypothetical protein